MTISWIDVIKLIIISVVSFVSIVFILRASGKRTLSKMNAFDFIVTVALGSVLATTIVNYQTSFWNGLITFCMLVIMQYIATWLSIRFKPIRALLKSAPSLMFYDGVFNEDNLKKERVNKSELQQSIRKAGYVSFDDIAAIILESDGTLTVMDKSNKTHIQKDDFIFID